MQPDASFDVEIAVATPENVFKTRRLDTRRRPLFQLEQFRALFQLPRLRFDLMRAELCFQRENRAATSL
jgi:hypothetical protein